MKRLPLLTLALISTACTFYIGPKKYETYIGCQQTCYITHRVRYADQRVEHWEYGIDRHLKLYRQYFQAYGP